MRSLAVGVGTTVVANTPKKKRTERAEVRSSSGFSGLSTGSPV